MLGRGAAAVQPLPADRRLGPAQRGRLAVEILVAYLGARRELGRSPIETVVDRLRSGAERPRPEAPDTLAEARRLGRAVGRTLGLAPGDTRCLVRSLVLIRLLSRRGLPARLVIGARSDPDFLAHAWVEHGGEPVLPTGDGTFGRLVEL
ncbi:MAG TPA: lasso peptide biosynthesis B2 protein [Solirubrobacterales bacterium]